MTSYKQVFQHLLIQLALHLKYQIKIRLHSGMYVVYLILFYSDLILFESYFDFKCNLSRTFLKAFNVLIFYLQFNLLKQLYHKTAIFKFQMIMPFLPSFFYLFLSFVWTRFEPSAS